MLENNKNDLSKENNKKDYYNLNQNELLKAKENCYILIGKTGSGKTSLLNVIYGLKDIGKVGHSLKSETKESNYYPICWNENNKKEYFCIVDTPGLFDSNNELKDENHIQQIKNLIFKENLKIKGFLYLSNFQNERLDNSEIEALIKYNSFFPHKDFWKRILFIFSHYYGDYSGDSAEEMKERRLNTLSFIFSKAMKKVKKISTPIKFKDIKRKYINIYSPAKNEIQKKMNEKERKDIIQDLIKFNQLEPLYSKIKIVKFKNYDSNLKENILLDAEAILYYDLSGKTIDIHYTNYSLHIKNNSSPKEEISVISKQCEIDNNGELKYSETDVNNNVSSLIKNYFALAFKPIISYFIHDYQYEDISIMIEKEKKNTIKLINEDIINKQNIIK